MMILDIAGIVFVCVTSNHLGLIKAIEYTTNIHLPIIGCVKCSSFWATLIYMVATAHGIIPTLAISFLASYAAIWLELMEGVIDNYYLRIYETIIPTTEDDTSATGSSDCDTDSTVS